MLSLSIYSCPIENNVHEDERVLYIVYGDERDDMSVDDGDER